MSHQYICTHHCIHYFGVAGISDSRSHTVCDSHGQERTVNATAIGQAETDVRGAAGGVAFKLFANSTDDIEHLSAGLAHRTYWHNQWVDDDIA